MKNLQMISGVICMVIIACLDHQPSSAKDHSRWADAPYHDWYENQHNWYGGRCCDEADAHPYYGDYTLHNDGSVTLNLWGSAYRLPANLVLKGPNPTGHAVWWYEDHEGFHADYCFAVGPVS